MEGGLGSEELEQMLEQELERKLAALPLDGQARVVEHVLANVLQRALAQAGAASPSPPASKLVAHELNVLTYRINGCAMAVHRQIGPTLREANYQAALAAELERAHLAYRPQQQIAVYDTLNHRQLLGYYIPDFIVEDAVIVEIKALGGLDNAHVAQVISYLAITGCSAGLLINFGERKLNWRRILPPVDLQAYRVNTHWLWNPNGSLEEAVHGNGC